MGMMICHHCGKNKPVMAFYKHRMSQCMECRRAAVNKANSTPEAKLRNRTNAAAYKRRIREQQQLQPQ